MMKRISLVEGIVITAISESANVRIGDTNEIYAYNNAVAVHQLKANFDIGHAEKFAFSREDMPFPHFRDEVIKITFHEQPFIKTGPIRAIGVTNSSMIHVGSITHIYSQSNIRHTRQLPEKEG